jgi:hypothetical protein
MLIESQIWLRRGGVMDPQLLRWLNRLKSRAEELVQKFVS